MSRWCEEPDLESCYIIHAPEVGRIKIGCTKDDPVRRLMAFQTGSPVTLSLAAVFEGGWRKEQELHRRFAASRLHGEWFADSILPDLLAEQAGDD